VRWREWRCALQPQRPLRGPPADIGRYSLKTRQFLKAFEELPRSDAFLGESPASLKEFDLIVVGSDEVWNLRHPWFGGYPIFFGAGLKTRRLVAVPTRCAGTYLRQTDWSVSQQGDQFDERGNNDHGS
jgi:hypothetical protein